MIKKVKKKKKKTRPALEADVHCAVEVTKETPNLVPELEQIPGWGLPGPGHPELPAGAEPNPKVEVLRWCLGLSSLGWAYAWLANWSWGPAGNAPRTNLAHQEVPQVLIYKRGVHPTSRLQYPWRSVVETKPPHE